MTTLFKGFILLLLLLIIISLGSGMFFLIKDQGKSKRTVWSLTLRILLSIILFISLFLGFKFGLIQPHGLTP